MLCRMQTPASKARILYVPHGGGPMPLLADPDHQALINFLQAIPERLGDPEAILVVSAHWEMPVPHVTAGKAPALIYDYGGFPPETYRLDYPAPGSPDLAHDIAALLAAAGMPCALDDERGYDHGMFVPLMLMYPKADIPVIQLSLLASLDAGQHIALGRVLAPLREKNILVLGSGMSFHNLRAFFVPGMVTAQDNADFETWLQATCTGDMEEGKRAEQLALWHQAPGGLKCHPRPEHLLPLHVCYGMAGTKAEVVFDGEVMGKKVTGLLWQ